MDTPASALQAAIEAAPLVRDAHVFDVYMSPGSVTERVHFYAAPYTQSSRTGAGGGIADEGEDIDVLELDFDESLAMVDDGRIADAKTIMLLQWAALRGPFSRPTS